MVQPALADEGVDLLAAEDEGVDLLAAAPAVAAQQNAPSFIELLTAPSVLVPEESSNEFLIENVGGPLSRGVEALQREGAMLSLLKNAKLLDNFAAIDRGETSEELVRAVGSDRAKFYRTRNAVEREAIKTETRSNLAAAITEVSERSKNLQHMPADPDVTRALQAETIEEFWEAFKKKPLKFIGNVGLESLAQMAPGIAMAIPAGLVAGVPGAAAAIGAGSGIVDYASSTMEALSRRGVDMSDEAAIRRAVADPELLEEVKIIAFRHAAPVALMDATSVGALARRLGGSFVTQMMKQLGAQATLGAGGEAAGQLAAGEGIQVGQIAAEAAGELAQAPFEAATVAAVRVAQPSEKEQRARVVGEELEAAVAGTEFAVPAEEVAVDLLAPERAQLRVVPKAEPAAPQQPPVEAVEVPTPAEIVPPAIEAATGEAQPAEVVPEVLPEEAPAAEPVVRPVRRPAFMDVDASRDSLTTAIAKLGGLSAEESLDISGESKPMRAPNSPMRFVIRRQGGRSLDDIAEALVELGFASEAERADLNVLRERIREELDGRRTHFSFFGEDEQARLGAERDVETETEAIEFAEEAGIVELERVSEPADLAAHREFVPSGESEMTGPRLALAELTARAVQLDEAATERLAIQSEGMSDAEYAGELQEIINANLEDVAGRDRGVGEALEPFTLASETEVERQARESTARDRAARGERETEARELRARADQERSDFELTGSERAADATGRQGDVFALGDRLTPAAERSWEEITERVIELAQKITPGIRARTIRSVWSGTTEAAGRFSKAHKFIEISLTRGDQETIFRHEALHALRDAGLFTEPEWKILDAQATKTWRARFDIDRRYARQNLTDEQLREEAVADAYGEFRAGTLDAKPPVQRIMRKIAEFFERLGNLLRGMGFQSIDDIFERVEAGEVGARRPDRDGPWESVDGIVYALGPNVQNPPTPATQQAYVISAGRALRQKLASPPPNSWEADAGLAKRLLVTPRTIAAFDADFVPVYQTAIEQWKFRDQLIAKFERESDAYFKASREDQAVVNRILEHDRLTGQVGLAGQNKTVHFTSSEAVLSKPGERVTVTDEQKTAYWSVRSMLNMALDEFRAQTLEDFGLPGNTGFAAIAQMIGQAANAAEAARLQKVTDILQGIEDARRTGYVPFSRYGEIGISVRNALTGTLTHYETIEVGMWQKRGGRPLAQMPEVKARLAALRSKYPGQSVSEPFQVPKTGMPNQVKLEEVDVLAEMAKIDNATWDSVRAKLEQAVASQGFRAHFFRSKNIPGYSPDFERGLANYVNGISGYLARRRHASKWIAAIAPISRNKPRLRQYAQDYQKYVNSPAEEFGFLRSVNFVYFLTSVASWIVNLTQVPFVSVPWTTQFSNPVKVSSAFARAEVETAAMMTIKQGVQMYSASKAPADVRAAVQAAYDQGLFIPITTYESMGIARNQGRRLRKLSKAGQLAVELFGLGFTMAERQNRISTFIALYRLARDNPAMQQSFARVMQNNALGRELASRWTPQAFAEFGIDETHFKAGKVNRPTIARNVGTLVFQFKMFLWNMLERMVTMAVLQGAEGRASAVLMLTVMGFVAGLWGLPGAEDMRELWELYMRRVKNHDVNADAEMRTIIVELTGSATLAEAISGGAPRALPEPWNIDLSKRIGLGEIIPDTPGELLGVSYDLWVKRPMQAMEQYEVDNLLLSAAELLPKQAADFAVQLEWGRAGVRTKTSDQPVIPKERVTTGMRVAKTVGFTSGTISNIREAERAEQVVKRAANEARNEFYRRMAKAVADEVRAEESGDLIALAAATQREEKIWQEIEDWNKDKPDYLQVRLDRKSARTNLLKEFEGADFDKGGRRQARGEIERLRQVFGRVQP